MRVLSEVSFTGFFLKDKSMGKPFFFRCPHELFIWLCLTERVMTRFAVNDSVKQTPACLLTLIYDGFDLLRILLVVITKASFHFGRGSCTTIRILLFWYGVWLFRHHD